MNYADRFEGRRAIITGGASGIGLEVARRLAAEGATVCLWDLDQSALDAAASSLGGQAFGLKLDIADWSAVEQAARRLSSSASSVSSHTPCCAPSNCGSAVSASRKK